MSPQLHILGIHAFHDAGAAMLINGQPKAAVSEERLARIKHYCGFPSRSIEWLLAASGCRPGDVDAVAINGIGYSTALWRYARQIGWRRLPGKLWQFAAARLWPTGEIQGLREDRLRIVEEIHRIGLTCPIMTIDHHQGHAAYAYRTSGWSEATIVTLDGSGDWLSGSVYIGRQGRMQKLGQTYIHGGSLGHFYSAVTQGLGFKVNDGEGKTMALACYGQSPPAEPLLKAFVPRVDSLRLQQCYQWGVDGYVRDHAFHVTFEEASRFRALARQIGRESVAAAAQRLLETTVCQLVANATARTGIRRVAAAGGLFLNVKASLQLIKRGIVDELWVPPHPGDGGLPLGYALEAYHHLSGSSAVIHFDDPYLGPTYGRDVVEASLRRTEDIRYTAPADVVEMTCRLLLEGKVVGWVQGPMEWGPRALGARSVLADPRDAAVKDRINRSLKRRDWFMPFAPSVLPEYASEWFVHYSPSPFMNLACEVRDQQRGRIPAVVHIDGTARPHTVNRLVHPRYAALIDRFYQATGIPMLLNTSFNRHGVPVVCSPEDALDHLRRGCVDVLVIENFVVERNAPTPLNDEASAAHPAVAPAV